MPKHLDPTKMSSDVTYSCLILHLVHINGAMNEWPNASDWLCTFSPIPYGWENTDLGVCFSEIT